MMSSPQRLPPPTTTITTTPPNTALLPKSSTVKTTTMIHTPLPPSFGTRRDSIGSTSSIRSMEYDSLQNHTATSSTIDNTNNNNNNYNTNNAALLHRMREVVLTHYRTSPSAPNRPIDLTHVKDTSVLQQQQQQMSAVSDTNRNHHNSNNNHHHKYHDDDATTSNAATNTHDEITQQQQHEQQVYLSSAHAPSTVSHNSNPHNNCIVDVVVDDDNEEEYVPPGLADFIANVSRELEYQQREFLNTDLTTSNNNNVTTIINDIKSIQQQSSRSNSSASSTNIGMSRTLSTMDVDHEILEMNTDGIFRKDHLPKTRYDNYYDSIEDDATYEKLMKRVLRNDIMQRCNSIGNNMDDQMHSTQCQQQRRDVRLSFENEEVADDVDVYEKVPINNHYFSNNVSTNHDRSKSNTVAAALETSTMLLWSPDIFTSPVPINPASLMTESQIKKHVFDTPSISIPQRPSITVTTSRQAAAAAEISQQEEHSNSQQEQQQVISPILQSLPPFTLLSDTNNRDKPTISNTSSPITSHCMNTNDVSGERRYPSVGSSMNRLNEIYQNNENQEKIVVEEKDAVPVPYNNNVNQLMATNISTPTTPSPLSMGSPTVGTRHSMSSFLQYDQQQQQQSTTKHPVAARRASSPIHGYAPTPEQVTASDRGIIHPVPISVVDGSHMTSAPQHHQSPPSQLKNVDMHISLIPMNRIPSPKVTKITNNDCSTSLPISRTTTPLPPDPPTLVGEASSSSEHVDPMSQNVPGSRSTPLNIPPDPPSINEMNDSREDRLKVLTIDPEYSIEKKESRVPSSSFLRRAAKKLSSPRNRDSTAGIQTSFSHNDIVTEHDESLPDIQPAQPIIATSQSMDDSNPMYLDPSPRQPKFTSRPPPHNSMTIAPSPVSNHRNTDSTGKVYPTPPRISVHSSLTVYDTPSPLSMSSPKYDGGGHDSRSAFVPSTCKTGSSPVPRFQTPPSTPRIKTAPRFTAEAAERLSRPSKSPQPPRRPTIHPNHISPLQKSMMKSKAVKPLTSSTVTKPSGQIKSPINPPPTTNNGQQWSSTAAKSSEGKKVTSKEAMNRLCQPTSSRRLSMAVTQKGHVTSKKTGISRDVVRQNNMKSMKNSTSNIAKVDTSKERTATKTKVDNIERTTPTSQTNSNLYKLSNGFEKSIRSSLASRSFQDSTTTEQPISNNTPTQQSFSPAPIPTSTGTSDATTSDVIDRLSRPTQARMIAIQRTLNPPPTDEEQNHTVPLSTSRPPSPFVTSTVERLNKPTIARKVAMNATGLAVRNSQSIRTNQSRKLPPTLDANSHLLQGTAVSTAKQTTPKKPVIRPPTPTQCVSGASDRLMQPTAARRASIVETRKSGSPNDGNLLSKTGGFASTFQSADILHPTRQRQLPPLNPSKKVPRPLTIPVGPRCANMIPSKNRPPDQKPADTPSLAQRLDTFGKCLRDDMSVGSNCSNYSRRSLTIPNAPKLATDVRGGEKYKSPKLPSDVSGADSNSVLQNLLRAPYNSREKNNRHRTPTIPVSPKFSAIPQRERPKSTAEIEAEQMEYFQKHQFKAKAPSLSIPNNHRTDSRQHIPGYMKPTQVALLHSSHIDPNTSTGGRNQISAVPRTKPTTRKSMAVSTVRQSGSLHTALATTKPNLGKAQRIDPDTYFSNDDDGLQDVLEHAARAAKALAIREEVRQQKLEQEEEERREQAVFRAKPIPRTTYEYTPILPQPNVPLVEPMSPELQTKYRVKERKEFDEYAERERLVKLQHMKQMEERRQMEEEEDINERRRLPVSEGGMIPIAAPVNSIFFME